MEEKKDKEKEIEELGKPPKDEVRIWGGGVILNKLDKLIKSNLDIINLLRHIENKIEAGLSEEAEKKLENIKRRF